MRLSSQEKAAHRAAFRAMSPAKKAEHVFTYYKWPIILGLLALIVAGSVLHRRITMKEPVLYLGLVNVSVGEELERHLTADYLTESGHDPKKREVYLYSGLYLSDNADTLNHEYAYASKMKLIGAISAKKLDLVLMNREAYDIFSGNGYLLDLADWISGKTAEFLVENEVILSDNSLEVLLGEAAVEHSESELVPNAIVLSSLPLFQNAGFDGELYLGVIGNSARLEEAAAYLRFVSGSP